MFVYEVEGWRGPYDFLFCRGIRARVTEGRFGTVTYNFPRRCLGGPDEVRVFAAAGYSTDSDLAPRRRTFYPAVNRG
jgi:hypothetical protein